jgi:hypothetical protein
MNPVRAPILFHENPVQYYFPIQWHTQEFFRRGGGGGLRQEFLLGGVQQIQLRTEGRQNGNLGAVAP